MLQIKVFFRCLRIGMFLSILCPQVAFGHSVTIKSLLAGKPHALQRSRKNQSPLRYLRIEHQVRVKLLIDIPVVPVIDTNVRI